MLRSFVLCSVVCLSIPSFVLAEQRSCTEAALKQSANAVLKVQKDLLAVKAEEMDTDIPPDAQKGMRALKEALAAYTDHSLGCEATSTADIKAIERKLAAAVEANKPVPEAGAVVPSSAAGDVDGGDYGGALTVAVAHPENHPELLTVVWNYGIECGTDSQLLVYDGSATKWKRLIRWQSENTKTVGEAFGDFVEFLVVPLGSNGKWAMAVAHGHPWCTSRWSGFDIDVVSPAENSSGQQVVFHHNGGYVRDDSGPVLKAKKDGFDLRLEVGIMDEDIMTRKGIFRYHTTGDHVERIQPIAMNGRDFVDEWLKVKWSDAEHWSVPDHIKDLEREHARLETRRKPESKDYPNFSFGAVRGCSDVINHFQVEANEDPGKPLYFQIYQGTNSFNMLSIARTADPQCKGANLMHRGEK